MGGHKLGFEAVAVGIVAFSLLFGCDSEDPGVPESFVWARDWNPLEGQSSADGDDKWFAPGYGLVADGAALRVE